MTRGDELFEQLMACADDAERARFQKTLVAADLDALLKTIIQRTAPEWTELYEKTHPALSPEKQALWDRQVRETKWVQGDLGSCH